MTQKRRRRRRRLKYTLRFIHVKRLLSRGLGTTTPDTGTQSFDSTNSTGQRNFQGPSGIMGHGTEGSDLFEPGSLNLDYKCQWAPIFRSKVDPCTSVEKRPKFPRTT